MPLYGCFVYCRLCGAFCFIHRELSQMNHAARYPGVANVNPKPILDMNYAFAQTALLMAAVRLHIFTYLVGDPLTATTLAALVKT